MICNKRFPKIGIGTTWRLVGVFFLVLNMGCRSQVESSHGEMDSRDQQKRVVAVSYALQYLSQRIAGDTVNVEFLASNSEDPKEWHPPIKDISRIQKSDLLVVNGPGAEYAKWLVRVTIPESKICRSCDSFELNEYITVENYQIVHTHGPEGEHSHPYFVPYPWLNPRLAIKQADAIRKSLVDTYPESSAEFRANFQRLVADLEGLASEFEKQVPDQSVERAVVSANPYLKYLTKMMNIEDRHLLWFNPAEALEKSSPAGEISQLIADRPIQLFLTTVPLPSELQKLVTESGLETIQLDTLDHPPKTGDFLTVMRQNLATLNELE